MIVVSGALGVLGAVLVVVGLATGVAPLYAALVICLLGAALLPLGVSRRSPVPGGGPARPGSAFPGRVAHPGPE